MTSEESTPLISILIPVFNRQEIVVQTIESALNQTYPNVEVVIVDNCSTDDTYRIIHEMGQAHSRLRVYQNETNLGAVRNWRKCLDYSKGRFIKILFSDDLMAPTFCEQAFPFLNDHSDVGFVFTAAKIFDEDSEIRSVAHAIGSTGTYQTARFIRETLTRRRFPVSPANALFRRQDVEKNLLVDIPNRPNIDLVQRAVGSDVLLYLLTSGDYPKFGFISEPLSYFRSHEGSISASFSRADITILYSLAKAFFVTRCVHDQSLRKAFNAALLAHCWTVGHGNSFGIRSLRDFYGSDDRPPVSYVLLAKILWKKRRFLIKRLKARAGRGT